MKSDEELLAELSEASRGLIFMSESEYPFETVRWDGSREVTPEFLLELAGKSEDAPVEERSPEEFFRVATSLESWRSEESRAEAVRYIALLKALTENLEGLKVYRVGEVNVPVYIVGRSPSGNWLGLATRVVET